MSESLRKYLIIALLLITTLGAFWPTFSNELVRYDDLQYIIENPIVQQGVTWEGIKWAFKPGYMSNWHPLTWISHMIDCQVFGHTKAAGHHAVSLLLHMANVVLLFLLLNRMTRAMMCSAVVAMLFAIHPLRVESVAWVAERKDVLSTLFGLLALWCYVGYAHKGGLGRYLMVMLMMALSLMSKPMLVTLPFLLMLLDFWPLRRIGERVNTQLGEPWAPMQQSMPTISIGKSFVEKLPLLALSAASSVITYSAQNAAGSMATWDVVPFSHRISNAVISYVRYLGKAFWPQDLAVLYPYPTSWPLWITLGAVAIVVLITAFVLVNARSRPYLLAGWFWFIGLLVPTIGLVQVGLQSMADRYTYLPMVGVFIMIVWGVGSLLTTTTHRIAAGALAAVVCIALSVLTFQQTKVWRDTRTLYLHAIESTSDNWSMYNWLGELMNLEGRETEALEQFQKAANLRGINPDVQFNLAEILLRRGDFDRAMAAYENVIAANPDRTGAINNLAFLLATHPESHMRDGNRAVELARRACQLTENKDGGVLDTLAVAYAEVGDFDLAMDAARRGLAFLEAANDYENANVVKLHMLYFEQSRPIRQPRPPEPLPAATTQPVTGDDSNTDSNTVTGN